MCLVTLPIVSIMRNVFRSIDFQVDNVLWFRAENSCFWALAGCFADISHLVINTIWLSIVVVESSLAMLETIMNTSSGEG
jgi:hypothetical protein